MFTTVGMYTFLLIATVVLASLSQANAVTKELKPDKFHDFVVSSAEAWQLPYSLTENIAFLYSFDYAECTAPVTTTSIFKNYNLTDPIIGDLTAVHAPAYTKCAGDIQAEFDAADFKMSNGVRFPGGPITEISKDALKSAPFKEDDLLKALCHGLGSDACLNFRFGFTLEMWISIKDYDTAFADNKITHLLQIGNRMGLRMDRTGGLDRLIFSLNVAGSDSNVTTYVAPQTFNNGLNLITVTGTFRGGFGLATFMLVNTQRTNGGAATSGNGTERISWTATDTVMRLGTADVDGLNDVMFNGAIHLAGLSQTSNTANPERITAARIARGLPNNPPVVIPNAYIFTDEDLPATVGTSINPNPTTDSTVQIYDFDSITHLAAISGGFVAQNYSVAAGASVPTALTVTPGTAGAGTFQVKNTEENKFTVYDSSACDSSLSLASLPVLVTDQFCGGSTAACAGPSDVHVCVLGQKDQLTLGLFSHIPFFPMYQASTPLAITATDVDNLDGTQYNYKVKVMPASGVDKVKLFTYNQGECTDTEVPSPYEIMFAATTTLTFCHKHVEAGLKNAPNPEEPQVLATTSLSVVVTRLDGSVPLNVQASDDLVIKVVKPFAACAYVDGVASACEVTTVKENTIQSIDGLSSDTTGNTFKLTFEASGGLASTNLYRIKLTSVPNPETQGSLYLSSDTDLTSPLAPNVLFDVSRVSLPNTDAAGEELRFVPVPDFFTRVPKNGYPEYDNTGPFVYGKYLAMSNQGFLDCSTSVYPGCAVEFTYTIVKYTDETQAVVERESEPLRAAVHVNAVETRMSEANLIWPGSEIATTRDNPPIAFIDALAIQFNLTDRSSAADDDSFPVRISLSANSGSFTVDIPRESQFQQALNTGRAQLTFGASSGCVRGGCSSTLAIRGARALINQVLSTVVYTNTPTPLSGAKTIKTEVFDSKGVKAFEKTLVVSVKVYTHEPIVDRGPTMFGLDMGTVIGMFCGSLGGVCVCMVCVARRTTRRRRMQWSDSFRDDDDGDDMEYAREAKAKRDEAL